MFWCRLQKQEMLRKKEAAAHEAAEAVRRQREELRECAALMEQPLKVGAGACMGTKHQ